MLNHTIPAAATGLPSADAASKRTDVAPPSRFSPSQALEPRDRDGGAHEGKRHMSRREVFSTMAATPLVSMPTAAILSIEAHAASVPSEIERLCCEWKALRKAATAACAAEAPLVEAFDDYCSGRPAALSWRPTDDVGFEKCIVRGSQGECRLFVRDDKESVEKLRKIASGELRTDFGDPDAHQKRAAELLGAMQDWESECDRKRREIGLAAAEESTSAAGDDDYGMEDRIRALPVTNLRDLAYRAAVAKEHLYHDMAETEFLLDRLIELAGIAI